MNTRIIRTRRVTALHRSLVRPVLGALLLVAVAVPAVAPAAGAEDDSTLAPGQPPAPTLVDSDLDGLSNTEELEFGLDPNNRDSDADGLSDSDGLGDGDEVNIHRTDPIRFDTDGDTIGDGIEIDQGSNPLDASSR